jgi:hypothetical protein
MYRHTFGKTLNIVTEIIVLNILTGSMKIKCLDLS